MNSRVLFDVRQQRLFIIGCLVCLALSWRSFLVFEGTEFGGGTLARNNAFGAWLFLAAVVLVLRYQLLASVTSLIACVYSLPLYLYLLFPLLIWSLKYVVAPERFKAALIASIFVGRHARGAGLVQPGKLTLLLHLIADLTRWRRVCWFCHSRSPFASRPLVILALLLPAGAAFLATFRYKRMAGAAPLYGRRSTLWSALDAGPSPAACREHTKDRCVALFRACFRRSLSLPHTNFGRRQLTSL